MRHAKKINHLGRKAPHRALMLSNMATSLILHKRISTTVAKAKALRKYVEPLITKSKDNTTHSRRVVFSYLQNKQSVTTLFGEVASRIGDRPGGYTRIIKMGESRLGDGAEMCMMELVDFNDIYKPTTKKAKPKTRRGQRGGKQTKTPVKEATPTESKQPDSTSGEEKMTEETTNEKNTPDEQAQNEGNDEGNTSETDK